ncbi:MAG: T9SS type A sorting domain-containing protein [Candidatus Cloacimonadales bacterium]|nr:T9SS type A sorting domain-containing protein [Candidatus Cloacimonadales bacterium]
MKKTIIFLFILITFVMSAVPIPEFDAFHREISRQTAQWQGTHSPNENSREYVIGDIHVYWSWDLSVMPPLWIQTPATCRAVGEFCYVFVADDQWNVHMDQDDVDLVFNYLENETLNSTEYGAVEMDINLFGPVPDELDNDPKVIVFYSELGSFMGTSFDGYFSAYNQVTEAQAQQMNPSGHSNECEMIYMTCSPLNPTDPIRISVLAHELQHMIHWGADVNEETWLNEGCSELAMVYFGLPDPIINFPSQPDNQLNVWNQEFADYVKVMLFFTYLEEHFTTIENEFILDIVWDATNGLQSIIDQLIENGFAIPFEAVFLNWTIANFIDDPTCEQGQYGYELLDLPNFYTVGSHTSFPVSRTGTVQPWATDYIRVFPNGANIEHDITINNAYQSIGLIKRLNDVDEYEVEGFTVNGAWTGYIPPEWNDLYYYVVYVYANHSNSSINYSYNLEEVVSAVNDLPESEIILSNYPNPFNPSTTISFQLNTETPENTELVIYNLKGQKIRTFSNLQITQSPDQQIVWDGTDDSGKAVSSGVYFYKLKSGNFEISKKMLLMK